MKKIVGLLLMILVCGLADTYGASIRIRQSAARGKRTIAVGDQFYFYIEVSDLDVAPELPKNIPGAQLMYFDRTGQSSSYSSVNGKVTQSFSYTYTATLRARQEGTFTFGPITVGGVKSNSVTYTIGGAVASPGSNPSSGNHSGGSSSVPQDDSAPKFIGKGDGNLFLKAQVNKSSAYEQEALVYTVKLYTSYDAIKFIGATAAPKFDGFVVEESKDISESLSYETYQGKTYATAVIARYIIFPQMTGQLKVTGNTYTVSVDSREYYHDPFFGSMAVSKPLQLNVTPNDLTVFVKGLPMPRPADFSGGVGKFSVSSELKTSVFKSNQAASINYIIKGTGNIKYIQMPDLQSLYPPQLEVYTPTSSQEVSVGSANVTGKVSYDYSFMPLEEGSFMIPEVRLVYFNPESGEYETSVARGYTINVGQGSDNSVRSTAGGQKFDGDLSEVIIDKLRKNREPIVKTFSYWLLFIIPSLFFIGGILAYRRYSDLHADMTAFNSRRADKLARRRLRRARIAMEAGKREDFYTELLKALWGYLGNKLKMPTSELMRDNIRQVLSANDIGEDEINGLLDVIDQAEFAKYSSNGGDEELDGVYRSAITVINGLEKSFKNQSKSGGETSGKK